MLQEISLIALFSLLFILLLLSAFFSSAETALMALNKYRLRHLESEGHTGAIRASQLLSRPDRLIGLILLGNNFVNIFAASVATIIGIKLFGEKGVVISSISLTLIVLLFAEVTPKTYAAIHPERLAFPASYILKPLLLILFPLVWFINLITNQLLQFLGINPDDKITAAINSEELKMALTEAGSMIPKRHKKMLMGILDLEKVTVEDVMVPRNEITGLNIDASLNDIIKQLSYCGNSRLPVYKSTLNNLVGIVHVRKAMHLFAQENLTKETLNNLIKPCYFIPQSTPLNTQLLQFQKNKRRTGFVVDEYGDLLGLVTLEDIFQEIAGEVYFDHIDEDKDIHPQDDGSYMINGTANIRDINRSNHWKLPVDGPKTINGLILEYLESIPEQSVSLKIDNYLIEVIQTTDNSIRTVRIREQIK